MSIKPPKHIRCETNRHGKEVWYYRLGHGPRARLGGKYGSAEFWQTYALAASGTVSDLLPGERFAYERGVKRNEISLCIRRSLPRAKHRAKKKGMAFDLTEEWVLEQLERQGCKCALTGIPFLADEEGYRVRALAPSLDRIDNAFGYTTDNVRIVVLAVNVMLSDWGEDIFTRVVEGYQRGRSGP